MDDPVAWARAQPVDAPRSRVLLALAQRAAAQPPGALREQLIAKLRQRAAASERDATQSTPSLSTREIEVLERISLGQSNKLIARDLGLSPHTIKRHVARILDKTGQPSRGRAADWFRRHTAGVATY